MLHKTPLGLTIIGNARIFTGVFLSLDDEIKQIYDLHQIFAYPYATKLARSVPVGLRQYPTGTLRASWEVVPEFLRNV